MRTSELQDVASQPAGAVDDLVRHSKILIELVHIKYGNLDKDVNVELELATKAVERVEGIEGP